MLRRISAATIALLATAGAAAAATPVADANGRVSGEIDGRAFELPVACRENGPLFETPSHDDLFWSTNAENVSVDAVRAFTLGGVFGVTAFLGDTKYEFGAPGVEIDGFPFEYSGEIRSERHGTYSVTLTIDCPN